MDPLHSALRDTQADLEEVSSHLALIREAIEHGEVSPSKEELARRLAVSLVSTLGFESIAIVLPGKDGELDTAAAYGQTERFGGPRTPRPAWVARLAQDVLDEGTLLRWGGDGIGARRRRPRDLEEDAIGLPLETGGEILGAILCTEVTSRPWTLARHRALELVGQSVAQVMALQRTRCEVEDARQTLELQLRAAETKLATQDERIDSLSTSLDVADRVKQTFLGLLSHELRTPLAAILGYSSLLREGDAGDVNDEQDGFLERIESNGRKLGYLLEDLLFLTESESSRLRPAKASVELRPLVESLQRALPAPPQGEAPELEVSISRGASKLEGDPALLRRLLFHLLDGAWRSARKTVRLEAACTKKGQVRLRVSSDGETSVIPDEGSLRLGQNLVRLCASLLDGRSRLSAVDGAEVWIPAAPGTAKSGLGKQRKASTDGAPKARSLKKRTQR